VRLSISNSLSDTAPVVAVDAQGRAYALWQQTAPGGKVSFHAAISSGGTWSSPTVLTPDAGPLGQHTAIAANASGDVLAVWVEKNFGTSEVVAAVHYTPAGGWERWVNIAATSFNVQSPVVAMDDLGNGAIVFPQNPAQVGSNAMYLVRYAAGQGFRPAVRIDGHTDTTSPTSAASLSMSPDGFGVVVWSDDGVTNTADIKGAVFDSTGVISTPVTLDSSASNNGVPKVAINAGHEAIAVWQQYRGGLSGLWDIGASRFSPDGGGWSAGALVENLNAGSATVPNVAMSATGEGWACWPQAPGTMPRGSYFTPATGWSLGLPISPAGVLSPEPVRVTLNASGVGAAYWLGAGIQVTPLAKAAVGTSRAVSGNLFSLSTPTAATTPSGSVVVVFDANSGTYAPYAVWCHSP
jgi:hypothetical protein